MTVEDKAALRREYRRRRDLIDNRATRSAAICERVTLLPIYQAAQTLHCYIGMRSEVDTRPLIAHALAQGKRVVVPVVQHGARDLTHSWLLSAAEEEIEPGVFGTLQPRVVRAAVPGDWELTMVPLLAFDRGGYRLGYGGGFYDRMLTVAPTPAVGLAFTVQEVDQVPREAHDMPLDWIVTEQESIQI